MGRILGESRSTKLQAIVALGYARRNFDRALAGDIDPDTWRSTESTIAKDPHCAYEYAKWVIGGRWPQAEDVISQEPGAAYMYAKHVICGRWPQAEPTLAKSKHWAHLYARDVIGGRWPEAEATIAQSDWQDEYLNMFPDAKDDWVLNGWLDWLDT